MNTSSFFILNDYLSICILLAFGIILACALVFLSYILVNQVPDSEKLSTYECGYEPYDSTRHVFSVHFCVVAVIFLIFDIEMLFIIPWCISISKMSLLSFWSTIDFIFELGIGFFYIWYSNALDWE
jgi:NADH-quinone oxidoreductase subunit A